MTLGGPTPAPLTPARLTAALPVAWEQLAEMTGQGWAFVEREIWRRLGRLESGDQQAADEIKQFFNHVPQALELLASIEVPVTKGLEQLPAGTVEMGRHVVVPVHYATDRNRLGEGGYGVDSSGGELSFGLVEVSVPESHDKGHLEAPRFWQFRWNPDKHVMVLSTREHRDRGSFITSVQTTAEMGTAQGLVFIHGYNVDFDDGARRAAQIAHDLRFEGVAMLYSWPSRGGGNPLDYAADADKVIETQPRLRAFLEMALTELNLEALHVIVHSMGSRALASVLKDLDFAGLPAPRAALHQVVFAAPDVNAVTFGDLAMQFDGKAEQYTLYASSKDLALAGSQKWNDSARAGDTGANFRLFHGVDTIDATHVDTSLLGHSSYGSNRTVLNDIDQLIRHGHAPNQRAGLVGHGESPNRYWIFPR